MNISVIIPVYNGEDYIGKCLDSVLKQTCMPTEIIVIDDGSTDNTQDIVKKYERNSPLIHGIYKENEGLVASRKKGIELAQGEYIAFVDADDWIEEDYIEKLSFPLKQKKVDIVVSGNIDDFPQSIEYTVPGLEEGFYSHSYLMDNCMNKLIVQNILTNERCIPASLWAKLFKRSSVLNFENRVDNEITVGEDGAVVYPMLYSCEEIYVSHYCGYHYVRRTNSMLNKNDIDIFYKLHILQQNLISFFDSMPIYNAIKPQIDWYVIGFIRGAVYRNFGYNMRNESIQIPFDYIKCSDRIVVYGAGKIGGAFVREFIMSNYAKIEAVIDKSKKGTLYGIDIMNPIEINKLSFDVVLIAVKNSDLAMSIESELLDLGVDRSKILWRPVIWK